MTGVRYIHTISAACTMKRTSRKYTCRADTTSPSEVTRAASSPMAGTRSSRRTL